MKKKLKSDSPLRAAAGSMADRCAGAGGFFTQSAAAIFYTPQRVLDYVAVNSLLPCPRCGATARTWTDIETPVTYCRKNCVGGKRFYRNSASASARAWNRYASPITLQNPPFGS